VALASSRQRHAHRLNTNIVCEASHGQDARTDGGGILTREAFGACTGWHSGGVAAPRLRATGDQRHWRRFSHRTKRRSRAYRVCAVSACANEHQQLQCGILVVRCQRQRPAHTSSQLKLQTMLEAHLSAPSACCFPRADPMSAAIRACVSQIERLHTSARAGWKHSSCYCSSWRRRQLQVHSVTTVD
jgi:hypothetical protein